MKKKINDIKDFFSLKKKRNQNEINNTNICYLFEHFSEIFTLFKIFNIDSFQTHLNRLFIYTVQIVGDTADFADLKNVYFFHDTSIHYILRYLFGIIIPLYVE